MNLLTLIKQYFLSKNEDLTIDVFDEKNIYDVYQRVVGVLNQYIEIETTVLQAVSYCFYAPASLTLALAKKRGCTQGFLWVHAAPVLLFV